MFKNKPAVIFTLLLISCASILFSLLWGAVDFTPKTVITAMFSDNVTPVERQIIWNVRLPRTLTAAAVGICLSLSGAILQGVMRNPLAAPNIIGVSSGAGLAAMIFIVLFPSLYSYLPIGAFIGALLATLIIYLLAWRDGTSPTTIILAGIAVSSILGAGTNTLMILYPDRIQGTLGFMVGGLAARSWPQFHMILPYLTIGVLGALIMTPKLNILAMDEETAISLGLNVEVTRIILIIISSLLAASAVSVAGLLGFVGIIAPHISRLLVGSDYKYLTIASILVGASLVTICDTVGRLILRPMEIPVGIIMSLLGGPFFLYLLRRMKKDASC